MRTPDSRLSQRPAGAPRRAAATAARRALAIGLAAALAGCGGDYFAGADSGSSGNDPPQITLSASPASAPQGGTVRLSALVLDDRGVKDVEFFRVSTTTNPVSLASPDTDAPYEIDTTVPDDATGSVQYFGRATDSNDAITDSALISVTVTP